MGGNSYGYLFLILLVSAGLLSGVSGQRTPSDLANISLNDLLNVRVADSGGIEDGVELELLEASSRISIRYRYKQARFEGYMDGTKNLSNRDVLGLYPVLPTVIDQQAHILGVNYRYSDILDFSLVIPYVHQSTDHIRRQGAPFTLESDGFGDISLSANYVAYRHGATSLIASLGISAPTGTIDAKGNTPRGKGTQLPYAMQLGSGTWDLNPGITLAKTLGPWSVGGTVDGLIRLGKNGRDYSLGNELNVSIWADRSITSRLQLSGYVRGECWDSINGSDKDVTPTVAPVADPDTYGGCRVEVGASLKYFFLENIYDDCHVNVGVSVPVWQDLKGPQPRQEWEFSLGISFGF